MSDEVGEAAVGGTVGYRIQLERKVSKRSRIVYLTVGMLLRQIASQGLQGVSHVVIDEVHERSLDIDFLLLVLKRMLASRGAAVAGKGKTFDF